MVNVCKSEVFFLRINGKEHTIEKVGDLPQGSLFYCNAAPVVINKVVYSFDDEKNLLMFFVADNKWMIQRKEDWTKGFIDLQ